MPPSDGDVPGRLAAMRTAYGAALPARLAPLQSLARGVHSTAGLGGCRDALVEIAATAHMLAGSAPTFGFAAIGSLARKLEQQVKAVLDGGEPLTAARVGHLQDAVTALIASADQPDVTPEPGPCIVLLNRAPDRDDALARRLAADGYSVLRISTRADISALAGQAPSAILVPADDALADTLTLLDALRAGSLARIPIIFYATESNFATRHAAARAGAIGFLSDPERMPGLKERLSALLEAGPAAPFRVLYVGNNPPRLAEDAFLLWTETEPERIFHAIAAYRPELLLLATDMERCDAVDIARAVWLDDTLSDLGIYFVSRDPIVHRAVAARGVTDAYFLINPADSVTLQARIVPYLHDRRAGLRPGNRHDLGPYLSRLDSGIGRGTGITGPPVLPRPVVTAARKVLIVDDDRYLVAMLAHQLEERGARVLRAYSGDQAYTMAWQQLPDVIVSDVEMPNGSGDRLLLQLRQNPRTRDIPLIVITNRRWEGGRDYALERDMRGRLGAAAYLQKPVQIEVLARELARL